MTNLSPQKWLIATLLLFSIIACNKTKQSSDAQKIQESTGKIKGNPPMEGFDATNSDPKAIEIADKVMKAMGGRENWDNTRYIAWNFLGFRKLLWDKFTGNVRVENQNNDLKILVNIHNMEGKVFKDGMEQTHPDSLSKYLKRGKEIWINDSYWLVMPFKLKDSGVTLKYLGIDTVMNNPSDVLELTFKEVGVTPQNKYHVFVDNQTNLVNQWAFYKNYDDEKPGFTLPWANYKEFGKIKLSGDRGPRQLSEIYVFETLPESYFTSFDPIDLSKL
ncbi:hypothetical protein [Flexithrix dorotheae]|uniref:hypothetical protein n=1 Tax=Flexithrix dorotheae TaxID=70993 RepID=UPI0003616712|nr:hypothetical protein [Flexithrix dorotheae]